MKYCKKCLQPDTRPNIYFDENQVCGACLYEEEKKIINWGKRLEELHAHADWARSEARRRKSPYDCVIGVSGGKDSTFQAVYAKEKLHLRPLLVNCVPDRLTKIGRQNIENLSSLGFDIFQIKPDPQIGYALAKKGFYEYGNIQKASEFSLWSSAFRIAIKFNIPFVIQGENAALTLGVSQGMNIDGDASGVFNSNTLKGGSINIWIDENISAEKLYLFAAPAKEDLQALDIRSIYLQYYVKEWSQIGNADFAIARGLMGRTEEDLHDLGRYRRYTCLDEDEIFPNQMIKYLKFGFGFATDEACYDIREGRLTREDAKWYVNEYDGKCGEHYIDSVCEYMQIEKDEFWRVVDTYVNKRLFYKNDAGKWTPKFIVGEDFGEE